VICKFTGSARGRFGVVPVCRALGAHGMRIAPRTYWARRTRPVSRRALSDALITGLLAEIFEPGERGRRKPESLYGAVKAQEWLRRRHGVTVARCTVARLMAANGWRGNTRARKTRTTVADPAAARCPDLVSRDFRAEAPGRLHVADFTYVPLAGGGFACTAFVTDAYAGTIGGWECSLSKQAAFVQRAVRQAAERLDRAGHPVAGPAIHHSDAGSQGGFNWWSQRLDCEGLRCGSKSGDGWRQRAGGRCGPLAGRQRGGGRSGSGSGRRSQTGCRARMPRRRPASRRRLALGGSGNLGAWRRSPEAPYRGATCC
jgi:putative transposase